jgi:multiple sugar transport system substrate-binding protein
VSRPIHVLFAILLSIGFLSCSGRERGTVTLSGWVSSPVEEKLLTKIIRKFEEEHPEIKVVYEPIPGNYMDKILLMLASRTAPDVFYLDAFYAPAMVTYNVLEPLDAYIRRDSVDVADFEPALLKAFQFGGKTYGLIKDYTSVGLFYNTEMFRKEGIERPPRNWEEFYEVSRKLTKDTNGDGKPDQWGFCINPSLEYLLPFIYQNGGSFFSKDGSRLTILDSAFIEALKFFVKLYKDGYAVQPSDVGSAWPGDAFGQGRIGMMCSGNFAIPFLENNHPGTRYAIAELPRHKERATLAFIVGYVMSKDCPNKDEAWQLLNYLTGVQGMADWTSLGLALPPRRSVVKLNGLEQDSLKRALVVGSEYARPWQLSEQYRIIDEMQSALQKIFLTDVPVEKEMKSLNDSLERMLARHNGRP